MTAPGRSAATTREVDVVIITALQDELDAVLALASDSDDREDPEGFPYSVFTMDRADESVDRRSGFARLRVAAAWSGKMGELSAASRAKTLIAHLNPRCLAMSGICAGNKDDVSLGDVIIADRVYKYDDGKLVAWIDGSGVSQTDIFQDLTTYNQAGDWIVKAAKFAKIKDWHESFIADRPLSLAYQRDWLLCAMLAHADEGGCDPEEHPGLDTPIVRRGRRC